MTLVNIGLGSNIGDAPANVKKAIDHIAELGCVTAQSTLYITAPWGVTDQAEFCNAAVQLETELSAQALLEKLKAIETLMGRQETTRWGPRLIDLDILTYGDLLLSEPGLTVPHKHMLERAFVLIPLAEIDPFFAAARDSLPSSTLQDVRKIT
ncbi:MAG TPA: 2-amino-4-hydroxy-6-hydroxymethyldihydropteridine diphosphokinase [Trichormus sp.]|jgi:2-amino-4-hydroxy-6-hydroxymethyldihydropteridine diphosphokinase